VLRREAGSELSCDVAEGDGERDRQPNQQVAGQRAAFRRRRARVGAAIRVAVRGQWIRICGQDELGEELVEDRRLAVEGVRGEREPPALGDGRLDGSDGGRRLPEGVARAEA
jgi:hypothetical protein